MSDPFPHILGSICFLCFMDNCLCNWAEMDISVVLICVCCMAKPCWNHFVIYSLAICSSSENCVFNSFVHLFIEVFVVLVFNFLNCLWILNINPLLIESMLKDFFPNCGLSHESGNCTVWFAEILCFDCFAFLLSVLALIDCETGIFFRKQLPILTCYSVFPGLLTVFRS
jgi:hypothetical protein